MVYRQKWFHLKLCVAFVSVGQIGQQSGMGHTVRGPSIHDKSIEFIDNFILLSTD